MPPAASRVLAQFLHGVVDAAAAVDDDIHGGDDLGRGFVGPDVAADGDTDRAFGDGAVDIGEDAADISTIRAAEDDDGLEDAAGGFLEAFAVAGVLHLDDVGADL